MSYMFTGFAFCPIAGKRCPNTEVTHEYCIFGESDANDENGDPALTGCTLYDAVVSLAAGLHDGGVPVTVDGHVEVLG